MENVENGWEGYLSSGKEKGIGRTYEKQTKNELEGKGKKTFQLQKENLETFTKLKIANSIQLSKIYEHKCR